MNKKVLIVSSSPRKHGNSDLLCDEFARGAKDAGNGKRHQYQSKRISGCTVGTQRNKKVGYPISVSYTHLDVYKRQDKNNIVIDGKIREFCNRFVI